MFRFLFYLNVFVVVVVVVVFAVGHFLKVSIKLVTVSLLFLCWVFIAVSGLSVASHMGFSPVVALGLGSCQAWAF